MNLPIHLPTYIVYTNLPTHVPTYIPTYPPTYHLTFINPTKMAGCYALTNDEELQAAVMVGFTDSLTGQASLATQTETFLIYFILEKFLSIKKTLIYLFFLFLFAKLDGVGPVDIRPSTN